MSTKNTLASFLVTEESNKHDDFFLSVTSPDKSSKTLNKILLNNPNTNSSPRKTNQPSLLYSQHLQEKRKTIYAEKSIIKQISLTYELITTNKQKLINYINQKQLTYVATETNGFHFFLDYYYNYLLLFNLLVFHADISNAEKTLYHLSNEMKNVFNVEKYIFSKMQNKTEKYHDDIIEYIVFISSYLQCALKTKQNFIYESILLKYLELLEAIQDNKMLIAYAYFYVGHILIETDNLSGAEIAFDLSYSKLSDLARRLRATSFLVSSLANKGLVSFVHKNEGHIIGPSLLKEAKKVKIKEISFIEERLNNNKKIGYARGSTYGGEIENDNQLGKISVALIEMESQNDSANSKRTVKEELKYLKNNLDKIDNDDDKKVVYYAMECMEKEIGGEEKKTATKNSDDFVNYCLMPKSGKKITKEIDLIEFQKFFLFLTSLSVYQIELLNKEQPDLKDMKKCKSLPIYFSNIFRQSLNTDQIEKLNRIKILNLKRKMILKNVSGQISLENLDLNLLHQASKPPNFNIEIEKFKNVSNINNKLSQFETYVLQNQTLQKVEKKKEYGMFFRSESLPDFKYQNKIPYEMIKGSLKKYIASSPNYKSKGEDLIKDSIIIGLLNKMGLKEIKMLNENPLWLVEILEEYKEKMDQDENSEEEKSEEKVSLKVEEEVKEKEEETYSDKNDNDQKQNKSIELIDAMNLGKDE